MLTKKQQQNKHKQAIKQAKKKDNPKNTLQLTYCEVQKKEKYSN